VPDLSPFKGENSTIVVCKKLGVRMTFFCEKSHPHTQFFTKVPYRIKGAIVEFVDGNDNKRERHFFVTGLKVPPVSYTG
jgi:hypothetical protein